MGINLLKAGDRIDDRLDILERRMQEMVESMNELHADNSRLHADSNRLHAGLDAVNEVLRQASIGFKSIRHRFLDTFIRDQLGRTPTRERIQRGNMAAHDGDTITDASLYVYGERSDRDVFQILYGLTPEKIFELNENGCKYIIKLLNHFATQEANQKSNSRLRERFEHLVKTVQQDTNPKPEIDPSSRIGQAYYSYWEVARKSGL